jgi:hypothetical protein
MRATLARLVDMLLPPAAVEPTPTTDLVTA